MKHIKIYEEFTEDQRNILINNRLTYLRKNKIENFNKTNEVLEKIRNYDLNNFDIIDFAYGITLQPDNNFKQLLIELNNLLDLSIDVNMIFDLSIDQDRLNIIDLFLNYQQYLKDLI